MEDLGFTKRSLRARVSHLLGVAYTVNQMSYDLARLRMKGLLCRRPGTNTYDLTPDGLRVANFYTKVHDRLLRPAGRRRPAARPTRTTRSTRLERHIDRARIGRAA
jgi:predicted MarR family transcription regulator